MSKLKPYTVVLVARSTYEGNVLARSQGDARARALRMWTTSLNCYEEVDEQLHSLTAEEVPS